MAATFRPRLHRLFKVARCFTLALTFSSSGKNYSPAITIFSISFVSLQVYTTFPQPSLRTHGPRSGPASAPCPLILTLQIGISAPQRLRTFRVILTLCLPSKLNNRICRKSNQSQSKISPQNPRIQPHSGSNKSLAPPLQPFLHLQKHLHFRHRLLPNTATHPNRARRAPPLELPTNRHLHPLPPPPAVKTQSFL